jgi:hypothetical protein
MGGLLDVVVPFGAARRVLYACTDVNPFQRWPLAVYQERDLYTVAVELGNGEIVDLGRFFGPGDSVNNRSMPDWVFGDDHLAAGLSADPVPGRRRIVGPALW